MTTTIEDHELQTELQELYLESKKWVAELNDLTSDLQFLNDLFRKTFSPLIKNDDFENIAKVVIKASQLKKMPAELKAEIIRYQYNLKQLISEANHTFRLNLIEIHSQLEVELNDILIAFKSVKDTALNLIVQGVKEDVYASEYK